MNGGGGIGDQIGSGGGGGGGGYTGLFVGSISQANAVIIAGGGGGGSNDPANGGNGGGDRGAAGANAPGRGGGSEHNLQAVARDLFHLVELRDLHFKEDLVLVAAVVDTSAVVAEVDIMVVVLMVQEAVDQVILDHRF